jgi:hypothetical protein
MLVGYIAHQVLRKVAVRDCRKKPVKTMISYSGDAGFFKNPSCSLYQVIITSFFRVVSLLFSPVLAI